MPPSLQAAQEALTQLTTERPESEPLPEIQVRFFFAKFVGRTVADFVMILAGLMQLLQPQRCLAPLETFPVVRVFFEPSEGGRGRLASHALEDNSPAQAQAQAQAGSFMCSSTLQVQSSMLTALPVYLVCSRRKRQNKNRWQRNETNTAKNTREDEKQTAGRKSHTAIFRSSPPSIHWTLSSLRMSASKAVLNRMQLALDATRPTPCGASRLV